MLTGYKVIETEQCSIEPRLAQGRHKEIKDFLEFSKNDGTAYQNLWNTRKAVLRRKSIAYSAHKKKVKKSHTSNLTVHMKTLE